jgi:hypothetical protein
MAGVSVCVISGVNMNGMSGDSSGINMLWLVLV